jgi:hypothetical protein
LSVGTLNAIPVSFPFNCGITKPTAFAAPKKFKKYLILLKFLKKNILTS